MSHTSKRKNSNKTLRVTALALTLAGGSFALIGCSNPKSEMADAINKSLAAKPKIDVIGIEVKLPQIDSSSTGLNNGELGLVLPDEQGTPQSKALADLASANLIKATTINVYAKKNDNTFSEIKTVYVPVPDKASLDSDQAKSILAQLKDASPGTVWSNLGTDHYSFGSDGYVAQAASFDKAKMGTPDPDFFTAVQKSQSNMPLAKLLAKLAAHGYLKAEEKSIYIPWNAPMVGEWTGNPQKVKFAGKTDVFLYFLTEKGKKLLAIRGEQSFGGGAPAVKLADAKVLKIVSISTHGQNMFAGPTTTVDFEETKTSTGINKAADLGLPTPSIDDGKPILSQVSIYRGKIQDYKPSKLLSATPLKAISYAVSKDKGALITPNFGQGAFNVTLGQWKLKSVDNFSKDKNPMFGGQIAQCTFEFEYNPKIKPLINQLAALGAADKDLPKPGATKPYDCIVNAMDKGFSVMGCMPAPKSGGF
jgi:hypothetical protein